MKQTDLNKKVIDALNSVASNHPNKNLIIEQVFDEIKTKRHDRFNRWSITGFALAAAITGIAILPHNLTPLSHENTINAVKLSPQLADDLEMLKVFGEDPHGT